MRRRERVDSEVMSASSKGMHESNQRKTAGNERGGRGRRIKSNILSSRREEYKGGRRKERILGQSLL